jgi:hypothetical protein
MIEMSQKGTMVDGVMKKINLATIQDFVVESPPEINQSGIEEEIKEGEPVEDERLDATDIGRPSHTPLDPDDIYSHKPSLDTKF